MTSHPDEGTLHAFIDGELPSSEAAALELHVRECAGCAAALAEARGFVAAASRTISALDAAPASGAGDRVPTVVRDEPPARAQTRRAYRVPFARAAALLLLAGGTAFVIDRAGTAPMSAATEDAASMPTELAASAATQVAPPPETANAVRGTAEPQPATAGTGSSAARARRTASEDRASAAVTDEARSLSAAPTPAVSPATSAKVGSVESFAAEQPGRMAGVAGGTAHPPAPPPPSTPPPASLERSEITEVTVTGAVASARVTRLRTKTGVVLTLTEEPVRRFNAEDASTARQRMSRTAPMRASQASPQAGAASAMPPAMNSYRWTSPADGKTYTLTGPMTVAELEATARNLGELERIP